MSGHRVERPRKSAKGTIEAYADELLNRTKDKDAMIKLLAVQTIALRMGWHELYNRLRYNEHRINQTERWWDR